MIAARVRVALLGVASIALAAVIADAGRDRGQRWRPIAARNVDVKAAFLYNFAKFAEWPALSPGAPIALCVVGDDPIAAAARRDGPRPEHQRPYARGLAAS